MVITYVSDLHLEWGGFQSFPFVPPPESDVLVIAGDLSPGLSGIFWLEQLRETYSLPVVYVPGNHCFWISDYQERVAYLKRECDRLDVSFLHNEMVTIQDVDFLGTPLWTNYNLYGDAPLQMVRATGVMKDYQNIMVGDRFITPQEILDEHHKAIEFLTTNLEATKGRRRVVVTHHAPSELSLGQYRGRPSGPFYASSLENLILDQEPELWIHGHIHMSSQYPIGNTAILCNPRGVHGVRLNEQFKPHLEFEF